MVPAPAAYDAAQRVLDGRPADAGAVTAGPRRARRLGAGRAARAARGRVRPGGGVQDDPGEVVDPDQQDQRDAEGLEGRVALGRP